MTSAAEAAPVLWITGLAGAGKSTLGQSVVAALRARGGQAVLLDGDALTAILEPGGEPRRDADARLKRAWRTAHLANLLALQGIPVVVATISLFHEVQRWNRQQAPALLEVLLRAPLPGLAKRRPLLYGGPQGTAAGHVVGLDIPAQYPEHPELVLEQDWREDTLADHTRRCIALWQEARGRERSAR